MRPGETGCQSSRDNRSTTALEDYVHHILQFRKKRDRVFQTSPNSPIPESLRSRFTGLRYFPIHPDLRFKVRLHRIVPPDTISMMTSDGRYRPALRMGYVLFRYRESMLRLNVYRLQGTSGAGGHYFVPFLDATSGKTTYGGGRYLYLQPDTLDWYILDFNLAYNPSCAYGQKRFVCPLPPAENTLPVPILAGEMRWEPPP